MVQGRMDDPAGGVDRCAACGATFDCSILAGREACWCAALPPLALIEAGRGCLCPGCLAEALRRQEQAGGA
jgi:hypothetical protein